MITPRKGRKKVRVASFGHSLGIAVMVLLLCACNQSMLVENMRCEYRNAPLGIDCSAPRFTWTYADAAAKTPHSAVSKYRVRVAQRAADLQSDRKCLWISDRLSVGSATYGGRQPLQSHTRYYWLVERADAQGRWKVASDISTFETGKMKVSDWTASWVSDDYDKDFAPAPMLRKTFDTWRKPIDHARLYISSAAYYKMWVNGSLVTQIGLNPGYTHYDKRNLYNTFDITKLLKAGENVIGTVLGNGFYNEAAPVGTWDFEKARWRNRPRMICELHIVYKDGTRQRICSDASWKTAIGAYRQDNIYSGDTYDARLETKGWLQPAFSDSGWRNAQCVSAPSPLLKAQNMPLIELDEEIKPVQMTNWGDTVYVFDFGKNISGVCTLTADGEKNTRLELQHGELLKSNGRIEMRNIDIYHKPLSGLAFQTDVLVLDGKPCTFTPAFTYHGFQYVEIRANKPVRLTKESLKARFFHTNVEQVGHFSCSNEVLNQLWKACNQSYLCNLMSIPTDCPQREKNGWTADGHVTVDLGLLNFDGMTSYEKWIDDMIDNQTTEGRIAGIIPSSGWGYADWIGPVWDAALFIVPMSLYNYYGDTRSIEKIWDTCVRYLDYLAAREDSDRTVTYGIGDWVFYKTETPTAYTTTCYYYLDNLYMAQFATLLGKDGRKYAEKATYLKDLIHRKYFDETKKVYANGSQAAQGVALYLDIVPQAYRQVVADNLAEMIRQNGEQLDFGMLGSKTVLRMLVKYGHEDLAFRLATSTKAPSWGNWMKKGSTTLPETWVLSPEFRDASLNHMFLGDINAWMYNALAGINYDPQQPGFSHIIIQPCFPKGLDWVKSEYKSVKGMIRSEWKRNGNKIDLKLTIPTGTTATVDCLGKRQELSAGRYELTFEQR